MAGLLHYKMKKKKKKNSKLCQRFAFIQQNYKNKKKKRDDKRVCATHRQFFN
jgi:hypothetical protein